MQLHFFLGCHMRLVAKHSTSDFRHQQTHKQRMSDKCPHNCLSRFRCKSHSESTLPCGPGNLSSHMYLLRTFKGWNGQASRCMRVHGGLQRHTALLPAIVLFNFFSRRCPSTVHSAHVSLPPLRRTVVKAHRSNRAAPSSNPHGPLHK